jgi:hypothetical protein
MAILAARHPDRLEAAGRVVVDEHNTVEDPMIEELGTSGAD